MKSSALQTEKATESQYQSGDHKHQEGHRFEVWEDYKNNRLTSRKSSQKKTSERKENKVVFKQKVAREISETATLDKLHLQTRATD